MSDEHDSLFRAAFEQPEHAAALFRYAFPPALTAAIDWAALRPCPGSFVDPALRHLHADLLFEATIGARPVLLYLLCEHKSAPDRFTVLQLLGYVKALWSRWRDEHPEAQRLPPVVPLVVHHGERSWRAPRQLLELIDLDDIPPAARQVLSALQPEMHFLLDDLAVEAESRLRRRQLTAVGRATLLFLQFTRGREADAVLAAMERWLELLQIVASSPSGQIMVIRLLSYVMAVSDVSADRLDEVAARIDEGTENMFVSTAEKMRREAAAKVRIQTLLKLLPQRFGPLSAEVQERVRRGTNEELELWLDRAITVATLDEVFATE